MNKTGKSTEIADLADIRRELADIKRQLRQIPSRFPVAAAESADGASIRLTITQLNLFSTGSVVYYTGLAWALASADSAATAAKYSGVVESSDGASFVVVLAGRILMAGLTPGVTYYLSDSTPGLLVTRAFVTAGEPVIPVVRVISLTEAIVMPGRDLGSDLSSLTAGDTANGGGELVVNLAADKRVTIDDTDGVTIDLDTDATIQVSMSGVVTITYPNNNTVTFDPSHFVGTDKAIRLREWDTCDDTGAEKKVLVMASEEYDP